MTSRVLFNYDCRFHPHRHCLVTSGGVDEEGLLHRVRSIDDACLAELFYREVPDFLVRRELLSPEWAERVFSWRHSGFSVHRLVRAQTRKDAEGAGMDMLRPLLALERLSFLEPEGKVSYRHGEKGAELDTMDDLEFIARVTAHIPTRGRSWSDTACTPRSRQAPFLSGSPRSGLAILIIPDRQKLRIGPEVGAPRQENPRSMQPLNGMPERRPIALPQNIRPYFDHIVRPHSDKELVESRMVEVA